MLQRTRCHQNPPNHCSPQSMACSSSSEKSHLLIEHAFIWWALVWAASVLGRWQCDGRNVLLVSSRCVVEQMSTNSCSDTLRSCQLFGLSTALKTKLLCRCDLVRPCGLCEKWVSTETAQHLLWPMVSSTASGPWHSVTRPRVSGCFRFACTAICGHGRKNGCLHSTSY